MTHSGKWVDIGLFTLIEVRQTHEKDVLWRKRIGGLGTGAVVGGECAPRTSNKTGVQQYFAQWMHTNQTLKLMWVMLTVDISTS